MINENKTLQSLSIEISQQVVLNGQKVVESFMRNKTLLYFDMGLNDNEMDDLQILLTLIVKANKYIADN